LFGVLGLLLNGIGLGFVAIQVALVRRESKLSEDKLEEERLRIKRQGTLDYSNSMLPQMKYFLSSLPDETDARAIQGIVRKCIAGENPDGLAVILEYLVSLEYFAVGVATGVYDLETINALDGSRIITAFKNYRPIVDERRRIYNRSSVFGELEWLCAALERLRQGDGRFAADGSYVPLAVRLDR
jgi:hypothetical protein